MYYIIYETTNIINGKKYRGCHRTKDLNDGYIGSGVVFKRAVLKYGVEAFKVEVLEFCEDIDDMRLKEAMYVDGAWVDRQDTYNMQTGGLSCGILSEESKKKISATVSQLHQEGIYKDAQMNSKGRPAHNKGKSASDETRKKQSDAKKGRPAHNKGIPTGKSSWNAGLTMPSKSEETRQLVSQTLRAKYKNEGHHLKGRPAHNKGIPTGKPSWNTGLTMSKDIICPHCGTKGATMSNMMRWHFDNCKSTPTFNPQHSG